MKTITACTMDCGDACSLLVDENKKSIRGNPEHPTTKGFCCKKGRRYFDRIDAEDRIITPLIKESSKFRKASWDEALTLVASRLDAARKTPESVLHIHGHGYRGLLSKASRIFFKRLGASSDYGTMCEKAGGEASFRDFGGRDHNDPEDIVNASRVINWGRDLTRTSIHQLALIQKARKNGTKVLTISPGGDDTPKFSDVNVTIKPGTDRFLAAAVLKLSLDTDDLDSQRLNRCANWPVLQELINGLSLNDLTQVCQVPTEDVAMIHDWYLDSGNVATVIGWGLQRYLHGGENVRFINGLAMISGNIGISGGGVYYSCPTGRHLGSWEHLVEGASGDRRELFMGDMAAEISRADPPIEFIWVDGHNVVNQVPDSRAMVDAFRAPFVVVVDGFMNDTALCADVILPPAFMFEREDVLGSYFHNCVNHCAKVMEPRGECRSDFDILSDLGSRLEPPLLLPDAETCLKEGLKKKNISIDELRGKGFVKVNHPSIAFENMQFGHADGLYRFPETLSPEPKSNQEYPLQLLTLIRGSSMHSQIPEKDQCGIPTVWVSKQNPACEQLSSARNSFLITLQGAMQVNVEKANNLHPDVVIIRRGGWMKCGHNANTLIRPMKTDMGDCTALYSQTCRLESR
ncbi:molybdopterin-dependent oxidoreductase [Pseudodesulfovibrio profundus]|nr:molybdopterin-dependent oxidoreductase [Pseudodesulfovibrio profundus]